MLLRAQVLWLLASAPLIAADSEAGRPDYFETKIRPILANNCYACHTGTQMGGLRLDSREAMLKGGKSGPAVASGDPDRSLLIQAVRQTGALKMPMGGKLKPDEVEALAAWVRAGAVWPESPAGAVTAKSGEYVITPQQRAFWSYQPLRKPAVPEVKDASWPKNEIDRFLLARLEKEGLKPAPAAGRRTLLRRASLDLIGLPPTPEEVEAFEKDQSPDAFANVVDRLLASPQYGERWGRMWLDVARYGEDDYRSLDPQRRGYNPYPNAYLYRDWVVQAFNDDLPYDQFVKAQLAADLLDDKQRVRMLPALGFLGLGPWFYDNGAVEITHADERHDRVDAVTRGFLGMTVACARCHDHKYDPIPTKDYYALAGVFANSIYHEYPMVPKAVQEDYDKQKKLLEKKEELLGDFLSTEGRQLAESLAFQTSKYMAAAWKVTGEPKEDLYFAAAEAKLDYELLDRWVKFLAKPPKFYPYLTKWQEMVKRGGTVAEAKKLADEFQAALVDVMFAAKDMKDENDIIEHKALPTTKPRKKANLPNEFVTNDDFCPGCGLELKSLPIEQMNLWTDVFQRDLQEGFDPSQVFDQKVRPGLLVFRGWSLERRLSAERLEYVRGLRDDIEAMRKSMPPHYPYVHGVTEAEKPADLKLHVRGSPFNLGEEVPRHFLSVLSDGQPAPLANGSGRLDLAEAIVKQPVAMRVIVNRVWKGHFGTGIVDTPSNFGITGERPSHPELLEYLAQYFVDNGMSIKKLHRAIMLSAAYQMSAEFSQAAFDKDSANRLYWRANRRRLDAEQIRDSMLAVSGALETKMGGPSAPLTPGFKRRTVYGKVSRYRLDEYLQLFDFPSPSFSAEKRHVTTVPLQRLFFMNSDFVQQQAELLARRTESEPDNAARIQKLYGLLFGRAAESDEVTAGLEYLKSEPLKSYEERKKEPSKPDAAAEPDPKPDEAKTDEDMKPDGMMAGVTPGAARKPDEKMLPVTPWGRYAKILLSSAEFVFVD
ncbi:MAG TPA: PSD1 and planctomycete cytochrome C domain-containing protein [Bryobacteraceae bacterium]